jgi:hypothetical protein
MELHILIKILQRKYLDFKFLFNSKHLLRHESKTLSVISNIILFDFHLLVRATALNVKFEGLFLFELVDVNFAPSTA